MKRRRCLSLELSDLDFSYLVITDSEQVEHGADRPDDLLQRGGGQHAGAARPARQVWEQDTDSSEDRPQL